jgi:hypothetical protein
LGLLDQQLADIARTLPPVAVEKLRKVSLYLSPEYPGTAPRAEYHPDAQWLREHDRDPAMAGSVEFTNIRIFREETSRMPAFVLHELAHAYHHQCLTAGYANVQIQQAFARAKDSGSYDRVQRHFGNERPVAIEKAYALTSPMEYFAETSEAFFFRNDFAPFTREELERQDPDAAALLKSLWNMDVDSRR